jgi:hypothetical protein
MADEIVGDIMKASNSSVSLASLVRLVRRRYTRPLSEGGPPSIENDAPEEKGSET